MVELVRHTTDSLLQIFESSPAAYTLQRTLIDWARGAECSETSVHLQDLVPNDYTLRDAYTASKGVHEFLHLLKVLAQKRAMFFRRSSPLRYMMEFTIERIEQLQFVETSVGNIALYDSSKSLRTIFRKNSVWQDMQDVKKRKEEQEKIRDARKRKRESYLEDRRKIRNLRKKIKTAQRQRRQIDSIAKTSLRFVDSKRQWTAQQRLNLWKRMQQVDEQKFKKMKSVIEWYLPPDTPGNPNTIEYCDPMCWTVQTCRHVSHVIR